MQHPGEANLCRALAHWIALAVGPCPAGHPVSVPPGPTVSPTRRCPHTRKRASDRDCQPKTRAIVSGRALRLEAEP